MTTRNEKILKQLRATRRGRARVEAWKRWKEKQMTRMLRHMTARGIPIGRDDQ